jgi:hypothetical protein
MSSRTARSCATGLVAIAALLTMTSLAQGWSKPGVLAISSPDGGEYEICRDGMKVQVGYPSPVTLSYKAYSPSEIDPNTGFPTSSGPLVAEGQVSLQPGFPIIVEGEEFSNFGTVTQKWTGGQLLQPSPPNALGLIFAGPPGGDPAIDRDIRGGVHDIDDCYLFPPKTRTQCRKGGWRHWAFKNEGRCIAYVVQQARLACVSERAAGAAAFRAKYGTGPQRRHALRNCVRKTT